MENNATQSEVKVRSIESIVAYLDILGYSNFLKRTFNRKALIDTFFKVMSSAILKVKPKIIINIEQNKALNDSVKQQTISETILILNEISIRIISDSVVLSYPVNNNVSKSIYLILFYCSEIAITLLGKFGLLIRGGIAQGPHIEKYIQPVGKTDAENSESPDFGLFLFSKAYLDAYELEKTANMPRVIIEDSIITAILALKDDKLIYQDFDDAVCVNPFWMVVHEQMSRDIDLAFSTYPNACINEKDLRKWKYLQKRWDSFKTELKK